MSLILVALIFIIIILLSQKRPTIAYWIFFSFLFNPGGYVTYLIGTDLIGRINTGDVFSVFLFLLISLHLRKLPQLNSDNTFLRLITLLIIFRIYFIVFYGMLVPMIHGNENIPYFFLKNRGIFKQFIMLWGFYLFFRKDNYNYYTVILYTGIICLSLYFITLLTGFPLIPVYTIERYSGSGQAMRVYMESYGLFNNTYDWAIIVLFLSGRIKGWKFPKAKLLYITGGLMIITLLLTLTRRVFVELAFRILLVAIIIASIYKTTFINILRKILLPFIILTILLVLFFPASIRNSLRLYQDLYSFATEGVDTRGNSDYRLQGSGGLEDAKTYILDNLILGSGYVGISFQDVQETLRNEEDAFISGMDASAEVWFWGSLFRYGILGTLMWLPILFFYIKQSKSVFRLIKMDPGYYLSKYPVDCVLFLGCIVTLIEMFTSHIYELGVRISSVFLMNVIIVIVVKYRFKTDYESRISGNELENI
ncbi:MAG: hypothetical protein K9J13_03730 [Saprospiraceae bacterium]|nr:hypothetical protein [Saprospiraceae bacterium]